MKQKVFGTLISAAVCAIWLTATAPGIFAQVLPLAEQRFLRALESLEGRNGHPQAVAADCRGYFGTAGDVDQLRLVMVGLLNVPEAKAMPAFCGALVEAVASRNLPSATVRKAMADGDKVTSSAAFGSILRQVYYAHQRGSSLLTLRKPKR